MPTLDVLIYSPYEAYLILHHFQTNASSKDLSTMPWYSTALLVLLAQYVSTQQSHYGSSDFLRFGCSQLVIERADPLVTPGLNPSPHMHQVSISVLSESKTDIHRLLEATVSTSRYVVVNLSLDLNSSLTEPDESLLI